MRIAICLRALARMGLCVSVAAALGGCASLFYERLGTGTFTGKLDVEWIAPNRFIYRPSTDRPLKFVASDGRVIQPRAMYTDGGSIPRLFWSAPAMGPWDFAPGYIIHDWLFLQHRCKEGDWQGWDIEKAARVLAEGIKTQMVKAGDAQPTIVWAIYEAVRSPAAEKNWEGPACSLPPPDIAIEAGPPGSPVRAPVKIMTIDLP